MCEKLSTGRARRGEPVPGPGSGPGSRLSLSMPIFCKVRAAGPGRGLTVLRICADISHFAVQKSEEIKMTKSAPGWAGTGWHWPAGRVGNRPILTGPGPAIGRQLVGLWPNSDRGSWNVKMVDGRPSGPRDSVFAASLVDCVWKLLCLPVTGECWGHEAATGPRLSTRSAQYRQRQPVSVEL